MNRRDLQRLAIDRLEDARVLLANKRYTAAYYLCGYAVECALKACIAKQTRRHDLPPSRDFSNKVYTHNLEELTKQASLQDSRASQERASPAFKANWEAVSSWKEYSRYETKTRREAQTLLLAVGGVPDGVLEWIKTHW